MKMIYTLFMACLGFTSCGQNELNFEKGDLKITVETGENWLHDFPLFMGIKVKNPPQFAIWLTDLDSNYVGTVFCTHKIAREGWVMNKGNRRREALPFWSHSRGVKEADGLYLPTKENPLADAVTGATPKDDYVIRLRPELGDHFLIWAEFNHSTDFNATWPKNAAEGTPAYSGGKEGSGQPALVYRAEINLDSPADEWTFQLVGHSSPDGSDGKLYEDLEGVDSALKMVKKLKASKSKK